MNMSSSISNIPVLTEIIEPPAAESRTLQQSPQPASPEQPAKEAEPVSKAVRMADLADSKREWEELEQRLTERILQLVQERVGFILEHAVKDSVAAILQRATEEMTLEIRKDLQRTLEVVVSLAVTQEVARLQQGSLDIPDNIIIKGD